ncbi:MAG: hypothetical protein ACJA2S_004231 [Cyclobacteriaceae bacterium]|jgi:hypothetical protein
MIEKRCYEVAAGPCLVLLASAVQVKAIVIFCFYYFKFAPQLLAFLSALISAISWDTEVLFSPL